MKLFVLCQKNFLVFFSTGSVVESFRKKDELSTLSKKPEIWHKCTFIGVSENQMVTKIFGHN